ncbi:MAG TPA: tyrosine-type recombinase/integrase [Verrucomicrobiae bacterium]|jgi:integrase|nr:tyrosine-type recombinase/integrase [Verrucomicrobiae bacterium]
MIIRLATSSKAKRGQKKVTIGRVTVKIYRRQTPSGNVGFQVANYSGEKRRLDSYKSESDAMEAAIKLARQLSQRDVIGASMTREQSIEYASAIQTLKPLGVSLPSAVATLAEAVKLVGDLSGVTAAVRFYKARNKTLTVKRVGDVVAELLKVKKSRGISSRYLNDLSFRLGKFSEAFQCNIGNVETQSVQAWLDGMKRLNGAKLSSQSYNNNKRVVYLLFEFAIARGYAIDNPVKTVESIKIRNGNAEIYTPAEITKLLASADTDFLPCLAIGAFAGLRSAEIERLKWHDVDLKSRHITVSADVAKTASRRVVPIADNLAAWLAPYAERHGKVWPHTSIGFYKAQGATAKASGVDWKQNALRHSFASYRLAQIQNAAQVALECGNSPKIIFAHYRELVKPADALKWFSVTPVVSQNVVPLLAAISGN